MHIHIHTLIHFARLLGSMRFVGTMVLMLFFSQIQLVSISSAQAMPAAKEGRLDCGADLQRDLSSPDVPKAAKSPGTDRIPPAALYTNAHRSVYYRLKPGIVMIPRMNRTPKPKSVYRLFVRAPGEGISNTCVYSDLFIT